jgi:hypothetical protein
MAGKVTETREVAEFDRIQVKGVGRVFIQQGGEQSVTVEADDQIIKRITTEVLERKLVFDVGRDWMERLVQPMVEFLSSREIVLRVTLRELKSLEILGACDLEAKNVRTDDFDLKMSGASSVKVLDLNANRIDAEMPGAGRVVVTGKCDEQTVTMTGAGQFDAARLETKNTKVALTGVGNATVWARENLEVSVTGVGSIEYYGNPHVKQSTAMLGVVRNLGEAPK